MHPLVDYKILPVGEPVFEKCAHFPPPHLLIFSLGCQTNLSEIGHLAQTPPNGTIIGLGIYMRLKKTSRGKFLVQNHFCRVQGDRDGSEIIFLEIFLYDQQLLKIKENLSN